MHVINICEFVYCILDGLRNRTVTATPKSSGHSERYVSSPNVDSKYFIIVINNYQHSSLTC